MPLNLRRRIDDLSLFGDGTATHTTKTVRIFHPGYGTIPISSDTQPPSRDALISVPAFDDGGIHYNTVHTACGILAGNRWDGYFSLDRDGRTRVQPPKDGILRERSYFFCLPPSSDHSTSTTASASTSTTNSTDPYPVVPRFRDWRFPHGNLPPLWEKLRAQLEAGEVETAARNCIFTNYAHAIEGAHLVPKLQSEWFNSNSMADYGQAPSFSTDPINASTNAVYLRRDIHKMFDERTLCFVPKISHSEETELALRILDEDDENNDQVDSSPHASLRNLHQHQDRDEASRTEPPSSILSTTTPKPQQVPLIVGHVFLSTKSEQLKRLWHNREVHDGVRAASLECLFARFAWTIFSPTIFRDFLLMAKEPRILLVWNDDLGKHDIEKTAPEKCKLTFNAARSRSESPTKRPRAAGDVDEDIWSEGLYEPKDYYEDASSDIDSGYHGALYLSEMDDFGLVVSSPDERDPDRGRTRKRKHEQSYGDAFQTDNEYRGTKRMSLNTM
ncbi:hypothetical protein CDV36_016279 [Fusarium kuroshium]|uniref:HNH nuclease domain-containing protein n=1 Tax=Fusarium kuroshium TaxID=2010991 RepID=A0A3M2QV49_9HYPO|nr:hypothetical protein CDV36_016279 [Fusarium kuroshium]